MKPKIGLITLRSPPAILTGSERFMWYIAKYLNKDYSIELLTSDLCLLSDVLSLKGTDMTLSSFEVYDGVKIRRFRVYNQLLYPIRVLNNVLKTLPTRLYVSELLSSWAIGPIISGLYGYIKSNNFDLIHVTPMPYTHVLISQKIAQKLNIPFVITPFYHYKLNMLNKHQIKVISKADIITVCTNSEKEKLVEIGIEPKKVVKVPMGIDPQEYGVNYDSSIGGRFNFENRLVILSSARMFPKGTYDLVRALELLKSKYDFVLVVIGPEDKGWRNIKKKCKIHILDLGQVDETTKNQIFSSCDIFCLPSIADAFGIAYLEAWIFEKPVIGARTEVMKEIINDGYDGLLTEFGNYKDLAQKLEILLADDGLRKMYGRRGRRKVLKYYTWDKITKRMAEVYDELLG